MAGLLRDPPPLADFDAQERRRDRRERESGNALAPFLTMPGPLGDASRLQALASTAPDQVTGYRYGRFRDNLVSERLALEAAYDEIDDEVFRRTGKRLGNPVRDASFDPYTSQVMDQRGAAYNRWHLELAELALANPALAGITERASRDALLLRSQRIREEATRQYYDYLGDGNAFDQFVRGLMIAPGIITGALSSGSPEQIGQLAAGGAGRGLTIIERAVLGALTNMAAQAPAEIPIIEDARRMGEEHTLPAIALDFAVAGAFGAALEALPGIAQERSRLRDAATLPPPERDVTRNLNEPGEGELLRNATAGQAESLVVSAGVRDRETLAELPYGTDEFPVEALADATLANDAYVRGDPDAHPVNVTPTRRAEPEAIEAAAHQADEAPPPAVGTQERVRMNGRERPRAFMRFDASTLRFDPETFQYKRYSGSQGSTGRLEGVEVWDGQSAGKIIVFEARDGTRYVADGHQRTGLAQAIAARDGEEILLDGYLYREADGWTSREVRLLAAQKNLRETVGDPLDTAALMREAPELIDNSIPQTGADFRLARSLSRLSDEAFAAVRAGVIEPRMGAVIGEIAFERPEIHAAIVQLFQRDPPANIRDAQFMVREAMQASLVREESAQLTMFGDQHVLSGMRERAEILRHATNMLRTDKRIFAAAERHSDALQAAGNVLATEENARRADLAAALLREIDILATRPGPVATALREIATRATDGLIPAKVAARQFVDEIARLLDERGLLALKIGDAAPAREPPPPHITPPAETMEAQARAATLRAAHEQDAEALAQSAAEVAVERAARGETAEPIPDDALGLTRAKNMTRIEHAANTLGVELTKEQREFAATILARGGDDLMAEARQRIRAFHGSPYDFDRFDISRIGTGEGTQAFGYGLYFAERESTAEFYRDTLAARPIPKAVKAALAVFDNLGFASASEAIANIRAHPDWMRRWDVDPQRSPEAAQAVKTITTYAEAPRSRLYEVSLPDGPYLDWDRPYSQQPQEVRDALARMGYDSEEALYDLAADVGVLSPDFDPARDPLGPLIKGHSEASGRQSRERTQQLREAGIVGIRYLDQGSRGLRDKWVVRSATGEAEFFSEAKAQEFARRFGGEVVARPADRSYNYVIFDDKDVTIVAKDGQPVSAQERADVLADKMPNQRQQTPEEQAAPAVAEETDAPQSFAEAAEQNVDVEAPWRLDDFDDPQKLRDAINKATLPELEAVARAMGHTGVAATREEYARLFGVPQGMFAKGPSPLAVAIQNAGEDWVKAALFRSGPIREGLPAHFTPHRDIAELYGEPAAYEVRGPIHDATDEFVTTIEDFEAIAADATKAGATGVLVRIWDRGRLGAQEQVIMLDPRAVRHVKDIDVTPFMTIAQAQAELSEALPRHGSKLIEKYRLTFVERVEDLPAEAFDGRYAFAGRRAKTADLTARARAEQRLNSGDDPDAIRRELGWFKGTDGQWRFEISEGDAHLDLTAVRAAEKRGKLSGVWARLFHPDARFSMRLGDLLKHNALFNAYPQLRRVHVYFHDDLNGADGWFNPISGTMALRNGLRTSAMLETVVHELQHAIQQIERFDLGGNDALARALYERLPSQERTKLADEIVPAAIKHVGPLATRHDQERAVIWETYRRIAGEMEAFDTGDRFFMTNRERMDTPPAIMREMSMRNPPGMTTRIALEEAYNRLLAINASDLAKGVVRFVWETAKVGTGLYLLSEILARTGHSLGWWAKPHPGRFARGRNVWGYSAGGRSWIVTGNVPRGMIRGLTLHEVGVHTGLREMLGEAGFEYVLREVARLRETDGDIQRGFETARLARTPDSQMAEEALAYAVQYADPETMSDGLRGLIQRIVNSARAWLWRTFPGLVGGTLTFDDMRYLVLGAVRHASRSKPRGWTPAELALSVAQPVRSAERAEVENLERIVNELKDCK